MAKLCFKRIHTHTHTHTHTCRVSQPALKIRNLPANIGNVRDSGLITGLGRSTGGEHSNPL